MCCRVTGWNLILALPVVEPFILLSQQLPWRLVRSRETERLILTAVVVEPFILIRHNLPWHLVHSQETPYLLEP